MQLKAVRAYEVFLMAWFHIGQIKAQTKHFVAADNYKSHSVVFRLD